jgi:hypothetical protein
VVVDFHWVVMLDFHWAVVDFHRNLVVVAVLKRPLQQEPARIES